MKFPSISGSWRLDPSDPEAPGWTQLPAREWRPTDDRQFARHVAETHFQRVAELEWLLERSFLDGFPGEPAKTKRRYADAIDFIGLYLSRQGISDPVVLEFMDLATALRDLERGVSRPLLKKEVRRGPSGYSADVWEARAYIAAALTLWVETSDVDEVKAAAQVAEATKHLATAIGLVKDYDEETILAWTRKFKDRDIPSEAAQVSFDDRNGLADRYRKTGITDPRALAQSILDFAETRVIRSMDSAGLKSFMEAVKRRKRLI